MVSELPSLTHAQLSEPSIQLTALPVPYTTDYTFMHNSQHAHNISMPHYSPSSLSSRQFESCCGSVRTSRRPSPLSLLSGISTATHYIHTYYILISGRLTLHWSSSCEKGQDRLYGEDRPPLVANVFRAVGRDTTVWSVLDHRQ